MMTDSFVVEATLWTREFGDVPEPNLVRVTRYQVGFLASRVGALAALFTVLTPDW